MIKPLATTVKETSPPDTTMRTGVVSGVSGSTVTVNVAGAQVAASVLDTSSPSTGDTVVLMRTGATWMVLGRPLAGESGVKPSGSLLDGGKLFTSSATKLSGFTAEALVADYTITSPTPDNNLVSVLATFWFESSVAGDLIMVRIREGSLTGTIRGAAPLRVLDAASPLIGRLETWLQGTGGESTWVMTAERTSGSGTCVIKTDANNPSVFYSEKVGSDQTLTVI